jgi:polyphosphate kinase 2 (PPK2 family)
MKKKIHSSDFRVPARGKLNLKEWPTLVKPVYKSKKEYTKLLQAQVEELSALQRLLYASNRYAVLLIFQAMDAAGKDGVIRHVMSGVNPQGCQVFSFTHPSATELDHDFLWRTTRSLPERGGLWPCGSASSYLYRVGERALLECLCSQYSNVWSRHVLRSAIAYDTISGWEPRRV